MRFCGRLPVVLLGAAIVIMQPLIATALTSEQFYANAQQITVRIDGANTGSGVIIERQGNTYTVVTNRHVVQLEGSYTVQTSDGKQYKVSQVKQLPNVDLAVFQFTSNQNYRVAEKGDSDQVKGGKTIYVGGYPDGIPSIPERSFQFLPGPISGSLQKPKDGYAFTYAVNAFPGMSGGPILDEQGKLVGINGRSITRPDTNATLVFGIPLKTYLTLASTAVNTDFSTLSELKAREAVEIAKLRLEAQRVTYLGKAWSGFANTVKHGARNCHPKRKELTLIALATTQEKQNQLRRSLPQKLKLTQASYKSETAIQIEGFYSNKEVEYWQKYLEENLNISSFTGTCSLSQVE